VDRLDCAPRRAKTSPSVRGKSISLADAIRGRKLGVPPDFRQPRIRPDPADYTACVERTSRHSSRARGSRPLARKCADIFAETLTTRRKLENTVAKISTMLSLPRNPRTPSVRIERYRKYQRDKPTTISPLHANRVLARSRTGCHLRQPYGPNVMCTLRKSRGGHLQVMLRARQNDADHERSNRSNYVYSSAEELRAEQFAPRSN